MLSKNSSLDWVKELTIFKLKEIMVNQYDLIIVDCDIDQTICLSIIKYLKIAAEKRPVIAIGSNVENAVFNRMLELDIYSYIEKDNLLKVLIEDYVKDIIKENSLLISNNL